jgi:hypothetical protein
MVPFRLLLTAHASAPNFDTRKKVMYNMIMRKLLDIILILGFLVVDFFFFHDFFKTGEVATVPQYLTGVLSIPILVISIQSFLKK